jgi:hypothetical protein
MHPPLPVNSMVPVAPVAPMHPPLPVNSMVPVAPIAPMHPSLPVNSMVPVVPIAPMHPSLPVNSMVPVDPVAPLHPPLPLNNLTRHRGILDMLPPLPDYFMVPLAPAAPSVPPLNPLPLEVTQPNGATDMGAMEIADGAGFKGSDGGMSFDIDDDYSYGSMGDFLAAGGGGVDQDFSLAADVGPVGPVGPLVDDTVTCVHGGASKSRYRPYLVSVL